MDHGESGHHRYNFFVTHSPKVEIVVLETKAIILPHKCNKDRGEGH